MNFDQLGLNPKLLQTVEKQGYTEATPIQSETIPLILAGHDVLGCAQTGTGKTAAFALPTLQLLMPETPSQPTKGRKQRQRAIQALVLTPTRELANQVQKSFGTYGRGTDLRQTVIYGGVSQNPQVKSLQAGTDIVIATPGRLLDLMNQGYIKLDQLKVLILDEADQMLDMGFIHDLKKIVRHVPAKRQTLMFSATMPPEIRQLASQWLVKPKSVQATPDASPPTKIDQTVAFVEKKQKPATLVQFLKSVSGERHLVFCRTKRGVDRVVKHLTQAKIKAMGIHGNKSQRARETALEQFSTQAPPVLVATDVAARGLHMPGVSHVVNYDLPETPETYVHRIGRTARAGAAGESVSFCSYDERPYLKRIERLIKSTVKTHDTLGDDFVENPPESLIAPVKKPGRPKGSSRGAKAGGSYAGNSSSGSSSPGGRYGKSANRPYNSRRSGSAGGGKKRGGQSKSR
jgi:ATP-dependent RNA helicase RhlE